MKEIQTVKSEKIDVNSNNLYKVKGEINIIEWEYSSDVEITFLYMCDNDIYFFTSVFPSFGMSFQERLDWYSEHIILKLAYKGSGVKDLSFKSDDYFLVFASHATGELEYEIIYYSFYFDFQTILSIFTLFMVLVGFFYVFFQFDNWKTEKDKIEKEKGIITKNKNPLDSKLRYCKRCGQKLDFDALYCHECGKNHI